MRNATVLVLVLLAAAARADEAPGRLQLGVGAGVELPQITTELGSALCASIEVGYRVWRNLSPFVAVGYSQPPADHTGSDPRLSAVGYRSWTTQRELTITLGAMWRLRPPGSRVNAFGALGARLYFLETMTGGSAGGRSFLDNRETSTRLGAAGAVGAELRLGPGAAVGAVEVGGSDLPHLITGNVQTTAVSVEIGYRVFY